MKELLIHNKVHIMSGQSIKYAQVQGPITLGTLVSTYEVRLALLHYMLITYFSSSSLPWHMQKIVVILCVHKKTQSVEVQGPVL